MYPETTISQCASKAAGRKSSPVEAAPGPTTVAIDPGRASLFTAFITNPDTLLELL